MRCIKQKTETDCGVACLAMVAGCSYDEAMSTIGFPQNAKVYYMTDKRLEKALQQLYPKCRVERKRFSSWAKLRKNNNLIAIVKTKSPRRKDPHWHWVVFDGEIGEEAILDPKPTKSDRITDFRGVHGYGRYLIIHLMDDYACP